jgi:hypothetical protein
LQRRGSCAALGDRCQWQSSDVLTGALGDPDLRAVLVEAGSPTRVPTFLPSDGSTICTLLTCTGASVVTMPPCCEPRADWLILVCFLIG